MGWWTDFMTLEVFSNLNDYMILWLGVLYNAFLLWTPKLLFTCIETKCFALSILKTYKANWAERKQSSESHLKVFNLGFWYVCRISFFSCIFKLSSYDWISKRISLLKKEVSEAEEQAMTRGAGTSQAKDFIKKMRVKLTYVGHHALGASAFWLLLGPHDTSPGYEQIARPQGSHFKLFSAQQSELSANPKTWQIESIWRVLPQSDCSSRDTNRQQSSKVVFTSWQATAKMKCCHELKMSNTSSLTNKNMNLFGLQYMHAFLIN